MIFCTKCVSKIVTNQEENELGRGLYCKRIRGRLLYIIKNIKQLYSLPNVQFSDFSPHSKSLFTDLMRCGFSRREYYPCGHVWAGDHNNNRGHRCTTEQKVNVWPVFGQWQVIMAKSWRLQNRHMDYIGRTSTDSQI